MVDIRSARPDDLESIAPWTQDTFAWGDYVPQRFNSWLEEPATEVFVCVDSDDTPIALATVIKQSASEAWMEAARVHPDHRRKGLGTALNHEGVRWAKARSCRVMRLATETDNEIAMRQVESLGYRDVAAWFYAETIAEPSHRAATQFRLRPATAPDAEAAWMSWSVSQLARDSRDLIPFGWRWRKARPADLIQAASSGELFQSAAGWVRLTQDERRMAVQWMVANPEDALSLIEGVFDLAASRELGAVGFKLPDADWTREVARRVGAKRWGQKIWAKPL